MAIAFDASSDGGLVNPGTSLSWSHTCTGANGILFVGARGTVTAAADNVTGVTYAGVALTRITHLLGDGGQGRAISLWVLENPATGTNTIVVSGSPSDVIIGVAVSYAGVKQTGQPEVLSNSPNPSQSSPLTGSLTTVTDQSWVIGLWGNNIGSLTAGSGLTLRVNDGSGLAIGDSNGAVTPAGSYSMTGSSGGAAMADIMVAIAPPGGGSVTTVKLQAIRGFSWPV